MKEGEGGMFAVSDCASSLWPKDNSDRICLPELPLHVMGLCLPGDG